MLTGNQLRKSLKRLQVSPITGVAFRLVHIKYQQTCLSSIGSLKVGGRYNVPNKFAAFYTADTPITALRELRVLVETATGLLASKAPPYLLLSLEYRLHRTIDLTDASNQKILQTNVQELTGAWLPIQAREEIPPTQLLGQSAYDLNIEALKVPSSVDTNAYNLVIFGDRLLPDSFLSVYDNSGTIQARIPPP